MALRWALRGVLGASVPYITLYPAVVLAAVFGGLGPGLLATVLSLGAVLFFFPWFGTEADLVRAGLFVVSSVILTVLIEALRRARGASDRARELLHVTLSSVGDAVISTDAQGTVTFLNSVAEELTGWKQGDAAGKAIGDIFVIFNEKTGLAAEIPVDQVIHSGAMVSLANHTVLRSRDGREIPIEDSAAPIRGASQEVLGAVLVFRDVTERRRAEYALQGSEERLKLALDAGEIGVWDWDMVRDREEWSERAHDIVGVKRGSFSGDREELFQVIHAEDRERIRAARRSAVEQGVAYDVEFRVTYPDGSVHWVSSKAQVFRDERDQPIRMLGASRDITHRKNAEALMLQQWQSFDAALSNTPDFVYLFDLQGRFTYINRALLSLWGKLLEEAVGKNFFELDYPAELAERLQRQIQEVIKTRQPLRDHTPFTAPTGETGFYEYIFAPVLDEEGRVEAVAGSTRDITERATAEERLRKSEERLTFALEAGGGVGTWDWDVPNNLVFASARFAALFSVDPQQAARGAPVEDFVAAIHGEDRERVQEEIRKAVDTGGDFESEYRIVRLDGPERWVYCRGRCNLDEGGNASRFPGVVFDITARKRAEEALRESQEYLQAIYGGMYEYMGLLSRDGKVLDCNPASLRFAENTAEDVVGRPFWETPWFSATPGMPELVKNAVGMVALGESMRTEMTLLRPNGEARVFDFSMAPIRNDKGEVVMIVPEGRDITDQKRAEEGLKRSNEELKRVNRELEEFAYVASHDLQEPLRMVNIYTQLILDEPELRDQYAVFVRDGVRRMEGLIHDLLTFSRAVHTDQLHIGESELGPALREALSVLETRIRECGAAITCEALPKVRGDASQMAHVFQNLISNSLKYCRKDVAAAIHVSARREGRDWIISVRDNGLGFEPQYAERIFGLFKRLYKEEYPGTGLGLAICKRIVERYGGRIWAEGNPGEGATFYFSLPAAEGASSQN